MTIVISSADKKISLRKGDTGNIPFSNLPTDSTYTAYLAVYDEDKNRILAETSTLVDNTGKAIFGISESFSNSLPVGEWTYALKICKGTGALLSEDTLLPRSYVENDKIINDDAPEFIVLPKMAEGVSV